MATPCSMPRLKGYRFPREIIAYPVWAYHRFALSTADVEDLLAERGVLVSRETVRQWINRFGRHFADCIKRDRPGAVDKWHLDEVVVPINGVKFWLWRAVDANGDETFGAKGTPPKDVAQFWNGLQTRFVKRRHSRYGQREEKTDIPDGCISVFLQGEFPHQQRTAYCEPETMLRTVVKHAAGRPVVVKAHPSSNVKQEAEMILSLMSEGLELHPTDANIHDILEKSVVSASYNSAVAIEGFMHNTPSILFGKSDFHRVCETVREPEHFPKAMKRALESNHDYPGYLYWYFKNYCYDINDSGLDEKLLARFAQSGFTKERLRLANFEKPSWLTKAALSEQAAQELSRFLGKQPEITRYALLDAIKVTEKSWVYKTKVNGEKVVVKRFLDGDVAHTVGSLKGELDYLETAFDNDRFQANRCLYAWPGSGVIPPP